MPSRLARGGASFLSRKPKLSTVGARQRAPGMRRGKGNTLAKKIRRAAGVMPKP